tara:strand:+ start:166 stop:543 length:378 start_codon:yes stop_codon:yes gene_type:complete
VESKTLSRTLVDDVALATEGSAHPDAILTPPYCLYPLADYRQHYQGANGGHRRECSCEQLDEDDKGNLSPTEIPEHHGQKESELLHGVLEHVRQYYCHAKIHGFPLLAIVYQHSRETRVADRFAG